MIWVYDTAIVVNVLINTMCCYFRGDLIALYSVMKRIHLGVRCDHFSIPSAIVAIIVSGVQPCSSATSEGTWLSYIWWWNMFIVAVTAPYSHPDGYNPSWSQLQPQNYFAARFKVRVILLAECWFILPWCVHPVMPLSPAFRTSVPN